MGTRTPYGNSCNQYMLPKDTGQYPVIDFFDDLLKVTLNQWIEQ